MNDVTAPDMPPGMLGVVAVLGWLQYLLLLAAVLTTAIWFLTRARSPYEDCGGAGGWVVGLWLMSGSTLLLGSLSGSGAPAEASTGLDFPDLSGVWPALGAALIVVGKVLLVLLLTAVGGVLGWASYRYVPLAVTTTRARYRARIERRAAALAAAEEHVWAWHQHVLDDLPADIADALTPDTQSTR